MPGKVKVRILSGRHLPVMDRSSDTTDAFAEVKLGDTTYKTDVYRKSLNPNWNSEWFRFDVDGKPRSALVKIFSIQHFIVLSSKRKKVYFK